MRIGIIGPQSTVDEVLAAVNNTELFVECIPLVYSNYTETTELIQQNQKKVDGFLFTGTTPFRYASKHLTPIQQWEYLPRNTISVLCTLLKAAYINNYDISQISLDSYDEQFIRKAYAEIGLSGDKVKIIPSPYSILHENYENKVAEFHCDNYHTGRVTLCVTGLSKILGMLSKEGIPVVKFSPTAELIVQQINKMRLFHQFKIDKENKVAVIGVNVSFEIENSLYGKSELMQFKNRNEVTETIYAFAQRIRAAVELNENGIYHVYTVKKVVEAETNGLSSLNLLHSIGVLNGVKNVAVGIGFAKSFMEAKYNAKIGHRRATKCGMNCIFIVEDDHQIAGPITNVDKRTKDKVLDKHLYEISQRTGIGMNKLSKIQRAINQSGNDIAVPKELARMCGMTHNSMNRLLIKLEESGYAKIVGKQPATKTGRPSRLVRLKLNF